MRLPGPQFGVCLWELSTCGRCPLVEVQLYRFLTMEMAVYTTFKCPCLLSRGTFYSNYGKIILGL